MAIVAVPAIVLEDDLENESSEAPPSSDYPSVRSIPHQGVQVVKPRRLKEDMPLSLDLRLTKHELGRTLKANGCYAEDGIDRDRLFKLDRLRIDMGYAGKKKFGRSRAYKLIANVVAAVIKDQEAKMGQRFMDAERTNKVEFKEANNNPCTEIELKKRNLLNYQPP
ncbi:hypothetical protein Tco_0428245 [Tanacetum coccineum]